MSQETKQLLLQLHTISVSFGSTGQLF